VLDGIFIPFSDYKFLPNFFLYNVTRYIEKIIGISVRISMYQSRRITYFEQVRLWMENCKGGEVQIARIPKMRLGRSFYIIFQSVWKRNEIIVIGRIVIKCNLYYSWYWQVFV
jgi:hypothetical protein